MDKLIYIIFLFLIIYFVYRDFFGKNLENFENEVLGNFNNDIIPIDNLVNKIKQLEISNGTLQGNVDILGNLTSNGNLQSLGFGAVTIKDISGVTGNFNSLNFLPQGMIMAWTGSTAPFGWIICDGTNGTPDLRRKFVVGAYPKDANGNLSSVNEKYRFNTSSLGGYKQYPDKTLTEPNYDRAMSFNDNYNNITYNGPNNHPKKDQYYIKLKTSQLPPHQHYTADKVLIGSVPYQIGNGNKRFSTGRQAPVNNDLAQLVPSTNWSNFETDNGWYKTNPDPTNTPGIKMFDYSKKLFFTTDSNTSRGSLFPKTDELEFYSLDEDLDYRPPPSGSTRWETGYYDFHTNQDSNLSNDTFKNWWADTKTTKLLNYKIPIMPPYYTLIYIMKL